jgi:hypothetical protein
MAIEASKVAQIIAKHPTETPHLTDEAWDGWCVCIGRTATVGIVTSNSEPTARERDATSSLARVWTRRGVSLKSLM